MGLREELAAAAAPPREAVEIEGVQFYVHGLTVSEQEQLSEHADGFDATYWVLERVIRDDTGARVFEDGDELVRRFDGAVVQRLSEIALRLMGMEERAKN